MRYQIDENTIYEDTGQIKIYDDGYFAKCYRKYVKGKADFEEVEGELLDMYVMPRYIEALGTIAYRSIKALYYHDVEEFLKGKVIIER